ncbi:hypothetical protein SMC26_10115 [Actinomadura fulvescens]|uniref:Uncharacterized protein n=1 Tax=Actinomadura fulvescens TaxID=46160 RepID=A0ABN3Q1V2_9ACTN
MVGDGLAWLVDGDSYFSDSYWVLFARGLSTEELTARLRGELVSQQPLTLKQLWALEDYPSYDNPNSSDFLRLGTLGDWTFAFGEAHPDSFSSTDACNDVAPTETVIYTRNAHKASTWFIYADRGSAPVWLAVGDSHFQLPAGMAKLQQPLAEAGLLTQNGHGNPQATDRQALRFGETSFGLSLPRHDLERGALLAARIARQAHAPLA